MIAIWKFPLGLVNDMAIRMPVGAEVLTIQVQNECPMLWARVETTSLTELRAFAIYGTGHALPDNPGTYVGTFQMSGGQFVFHVFEMRP